MTSNDVVIRVATVTETAKGRTDTYIAAIANNDGLPSYRRGENARAIAIDRALTVHMTSHSQEIAAALAAGETFHISVLDVDHIPETRS